MEFAIEAPGEATPLTTQNLYKTLLSASSTDRQQLKTGAQQLHNWEKYPGFYSSLQTIFIDPSIPLEARYLALIQLKNGIDKHWRKTATNAIKKEEKLLIRVRSLEFGISEPDHRLALHNALIISKIIRFEFPHEWPDAISSIVEKLRSVSQDPNTSLKLSRTLLILLYTIKELAMGRLMRARANLRAVAPEILQLLGSIYVKKVTVWKTFLEEGGDDEGGALESIEQSLLSLRVLRRLIVAGYDFPNRYTELQSFWSVICTQFGQMFSFVLRNSSSVNYVVEDLVEKHLLQMAKLHLNMAKDHPAGFALLSDPIVLVHLYWKIVTCVSETFGSNTPIPCSKIGNDGDVDENEMTILEKLCLKGLLILRACVRMVFNPAQSFKYQSPEDKEEKKRSMELIKQKLLTESFVRDLTVTLVTRFFVFRSRDLRDWEEQPEEWERREEGDGDIWEYSIRSCAEKLFLDLAISHKDILVEPLLQFFYKAADLQNPSILLKDSIYAAIGLAAPILESKLDFGTFLESTLVPEVQIQRPGYGIIRRRVAIMLGQWLLVKEGLDRILVYQIFQYLLDKRDQLNDQVVRVTAGRQLKNVIDPFEFKAEGFIPFAQNILDRLIDLIEEVELVETKMALVNTITIMVAKMEHHISPFADQLFSLLSRLWTHAEEEYLMKQSILAVLSELVTSMQEDSQRYHPDIIPLISNSVDVGTENPFHLLEDAMDLWSAILVHTPSPASEGIKNLANYLFPLYDFSSETLIKALNITQSYVFLIPQEFLVESPRLLTPFASLLGNAKREPVEFVNDIVELLLRSAESLGGLEAVTHLTTNLISTKFLSTLLTGLRDAYSAHQTTGPNRALDSIDGIEETEHFCILARIALVAPSLFVSAIEAALPTDPFEDTVSWLLTEWFSHFDNIAHPGRQKLSCLALTALLESNQPWILGRLQELMTIWTDTINELIDPDKGGTDCLIYWDEAALKGEGKESPDQERRRKLNFVDPVHRLDIKVFVREKLQAAVGACGGGDVFQTTWVVNVDADVLKAFMELGVI